MDMVSRPGIQSVKAIVLLLSFYLISQRSFAQGSATTLAELPVTISLTKDALKASDKMAAEIWISNPSDSNVNVKILLKGPSFVHLTGFLREGAKGTCPGGVNSENSVSYVVNPNGVVGGRLCLAVDDNVQEGDFNLLFLILARKPTDREYITLKAVEKKIQIGLLGTETVGGFSQRLAILLLPGILFWLPFRIFPLIKNIESAFDKGALVVLTSALIVAIAPYWEYTNISDGVSIEELIIISIGSAVLGMLAAFILWAFLRLAARSRAEIEQRIYFYRNDPFEKVFVKLLAINVTKDSESRNTIVTLNDGAKLNGCMFGRSKDGAYAVIGSAKVDPKGDAKLRAELKNLERDRKWSEILNLAKRRKLSLIPDVSVQELTSRSEWEPKDYLIWVDEENFNKSEKDNQQIWHPIIVQQ